jgi:hypothetical protein
MNQVKPTLIKIGEKEYYNSKDLQIYDPIFYYGCKTKPRTIIQKKKIEESEYIYANLKTGEWNLSTSDCKKAQLLISKTWVDKYFFKPEIIVPNFIERNIIAVQKKVVVEELVEEEEEEEEDAPPLLYLNDSEKFKDVDGNIIEIETRGTKNRNNIYFKVKDIMAAFEMPNLNDSLTKIVGTYERNIHYQSFKREIRPTTSRSKIANKNYKTTLYLTYKGLLKVLYVSRCGVAEKFQDWAEECLFTIQMGAKDEKIKLGTNILNISVKTYRAVFDAYASKFPSIYLLSLGKVEKLRETFGIEESIDSSLTVYKYGFTDDLSRRIGEHESKYGKMTGVSLKLATFHIIDSKYTSEAEGEVRELCNVFEKKLCVDGYNELIVLNDAELVQIKKQYKYIGKEFAGATQELQEQIVVLKDRIKEYENELVNMKIMHKSELLEKDNKLLEKDMIIQQERNEKGIIKNQMDNNMTIFNLEKQILQMQLSSKVLN